MLLSWFLKLYMLVKYQINKYMKIVSVRVVGLDKKNWVFERITKCEFVSC